MHYSLLFMFLAQEVDQIVRSFGRMRGARGSARIDPGIVLLTGPYASRCGSLQIGSWCGVRYAGASIVWILGQGRVCVCVGGEGTNHWRGLKEKAHSYHGNTKTSARDAARRLRGIQSWRRVREPHKTEKSTRALFLPTFVRDKRESTDDGIRGFFFWYLQGHC